MKEDDGYDADVEDRKIPHSVAEEYDIARKEGR